jgi:hypothetical protein
MLLSGTLNEVFKLLRHSFEKSIAPLRPGGLQILGRHSGPRGYLLRGKLPLGSGVPVLPAGEK